MQTVNVLIACEFSGVVRDAFIGAGHNAWSCDLLPTERGTQHFMWDCLSIARASKWDLMICHPPCTYLCRSGIHWNKTRPERQALTDAAVEFARELLAMDHIPKIALENPVGVLSSRIRKPDQIIQPWQFGHGETKATCLWLKGLPKLSPTNIVPGREPKTHYAAPGENRWRVRSRTHEGIAQAMAGQWGAVELCTSSSAIRPVACV